MLSLLAEIARLQLDERCTSAELAARQARDLREAVRAAMSGTALYARLYREAGVSADAIRDLADVARLPIVDHGWYRRQPAEERQSRDVDLARCHVRKTSGSSGIPLTLHVTPRDMTVRKAIWYWSRWRAGLRPGWRQWTVGGFHARKISRWAARWHRYLSMDEAVAAFEHGAPDLLHGYPSQLAVLMLRLRAMNRKGFSLKAVTTGGETLEDPLRRQLEEFFGAPIRDFYGTHETGVAATPCPTGRGFHVASRHHVLEILNGDRTARPGEEGDVVLTCFASRATPILRYAIGDRAVAGDAKCACGSPFARIEAFSGRSADVLRGTEGQVISAMMVNKPFFGHPHIVQYRVTERGPGDILVELVMTADPDSELLTRAVSYYREVLGAVRVEVRRVSELAPDASGKHRRFVSLGGGVL